MTGRCPGFSRSVLPQTFEVKCPGCGRVLEFFSDETKRRCKCGRVVYRESVPTCADWCPFAADCLSGLLPPERIGELKKRERAKEENTEFFERVVKLCQAKFAKRGSDMG